MENNKKNQVENENIPAPKSLKKINKKTKILGIMIIVLFIISKIFGFQTAIGSIAAIIEIILAVIFVVANIKNRASK